MIVGIGDAGHVIQWFKANSRAEWLGFFVAGDRKYNHLLNEVLAQGDVFDVISGYDIDLLLFGAGGKIGILSQGKDFRVDATPLTELKQGDAPIKIANIHEVNRSAVGVKHITKASVAASHRIVELLGLGVDDLPSLAFIRKDFDFREKGPKLVLPTRGQADAEFLVNFVRSMRRVLEKHRKASDKQIYSETIERFPTLIQDVERQSAFLSEMLRSAGLDIGAHSLTTAILNSPSLRQGFAIVAAQSGIDLSVMERALEDDLGAKRVQGHLGKSQKRISETVSRAHDYVALREAVYADLEEVVERFQRRVSFRVTTGHFRHFFSFSTDALSKAKKLINLAAAVKSGGTSLLS